MRVTSSFLRNYRADGTPAARLERVLAVGRAFLTVTALVAIYLDPTEPARLATATYGVLLAYAIYSVAVLAWTHTSVQIASVHGRVLHALDVLWTAALTFVSEGPVSPFFLFFLYVVAASAYRWGFRETVATAGTTIAIFLVETIVAANGPWNRTWFSSIDFELNRTILRVAYLLLTGFLLGYLAEQEKQSRAELAAIADLPRQPRIDLGLRGSITAVAEGLLRTFDASAIAIVLRQNGGGAPSLWHLPRTTAGASAVRADRRELDAAELATWLFADPGRTWHATIPVDGSTTTVFRVAEPAVWQLRRIRGDWPAGLTTGSDATTVTAVNMGLPDEWTGRIYLFDIPAVDSLERTVHFLEAVTERITPALTNVFLLRRLRLQDSAAERARVARELHDGAIQALIGIEMKLEGLRRRAGSEPAYLKQDLLEIQDMVRHEVLALRELMQALRPVELDANEKLADVLVGVVERFRRDSGISARFVTTGEAPSLQPTAALEVVRIVQEALVNARKHSRANNVLVRLTQDNGRHHLSVEDDGRGFDFEGSLSAPELDARRIGPAIIKERARVLGADLVIHSSPGVGARVELTLTGGTRA